jgi:hypothetical protein
MVVVTALRAIGARDMAVVHDHNDLKRTRPLRRASDVLRKGDLEVLRRRTLRRGHSVENHRLRGRPNRVIDGRGNSRNTGGRSHRHACSRVSGIGERRGRLRRGCPLDERHSPPARMWDRRGNRNRDGLTRLIVRHRSSWSATALVAAGARFLGRSIGRVCLPGSGRGEYEVSISRRRREDKDGQNGHDGRNHGWACAAVCLKKFKHGGAPFNPRATPATNRHHRVAA